MTKCRNQKQSKILRTREGRVLSEGEKGVKDISSGGWERMRFWGPARSDHSQTLMSFLAAISHPSIHPSIHPTLVSHSVPSAVLGRQNSCISCLCLGNKLP